MRPFSRRVSPQTPISILFSPLLRAIRPQPASRRLLHCQTILSRTPNEADLLSSIKSLPPSSLGNGPNLNIIAFVSQDLAHLLTPPNPFIQHIVSSLTRDAGRESSSSYPDAITLIAGAVDQIACPSGSAPDAPTGGLSYLAYEDDATDPSSSSGSDRPKASKGSVSILLPQPSAGHPSAPPLTIHIPLSNTIFRTGHETTLLSSTFTRSSSASSTHTSQPLFQLSSTQWLSSAHLTLPSLAPAPGAPQSPSSKLSIPLHPLTIARQISRAMGNILRTLSSANGPLPASLELESAVSAHLASSNTSPSHQQGPLQIFALVTPSAPSPLQASAPSIPWSSLLLSHHTDSSSSSTNSATTFSFSPARPSPGAHLYRVLSGGGGWGDKAGLLSLDPDPLFPESGSGEDGEAQFSERYFARQKGAAAAAAVAAKEKVDQERVAGAAAAERMVAQDLELDATEGQEFGRIATVGQFVQFFVVVPVPEQEVGGGTGAGADAGGQMAFVGCVAEAEMEDLDGAAYGGGSGDGPQGSNQQVASHAADVRSYDGFFGVRSHRGFGVGDRKVDVPGASLAVRL